MDLGLHDKTALVTAASRGLGQAVALRLAQEGAHVVICARNEEILYETAAEIKTELLKTVQDKGAKDVLKNMEPDEVHAMVSAIASDWDVEGW